MVKIHIAMLIAIFAVSTMGCATSESIYTASKDEIVTFKTAPEDTIVVFPKNFRAPKKLESSDKDVEMYLRFADAMDVINYKTEQRRIAKKEAWEKYKMEREEYLERVKAERKLNEERSNDERIYSRWWRYSHNRRYASYYWFGFYPIGPNYYQEWWDPSLPNTGHRAYLRAATSKQVLGSTNAPTTRGTTITNGKITNPSRTTGN